MKTFSKALTVVAVAAAALVSVSAQAVTVSFGGLDTNVVGGDQSGLTSTRANIANIINPNTGVFIETFDLATKNTDPRLAASGTTGPFIGQNAQGGNATAPYIGIVQGQGCSINSFGAVNISVPQGSFTVQKGSINNVAATPAGDSTCFGFGPGPAPRNAGSNAKVLIDYTNFISDLTLAGLAAAGDSIGYLGLYYGSIDTYNDITFYSNVAAKTKVVGAGILSDGMITGSELLALYPGSTSGNQFSANTNLYLNFLFGAGEGFQGFEFSTTGIAYEVDNIVVALASRTEVPEPASLALVGLGLVGVAAARRRKLAK